MAQATIQARIIAPPPGCVLSPNPLPLHLIRARINPLPILNLRIIITPCIKPFTITKTKLQMTPELSDVCVVMAGVEVGGDGGEVDGVGNVGGVGGKEG